MLHSQVSYVAFIFLYGYVITMYFPPFDSSKTFGGLSVVEFILYFWIFTIIMEEIRQVGDMISGITWSWQELCHVVKSHTEVTW